MIELRKQDIGKADGLRLLEGNTREREGKKKKKRRANPRFPGVKEPGMLTTDHAATRETLRLFHGGVRDRKRPRVCESTDQKEEKQTVRRESDRLVVPMKPGNAGGGKEPARNRSEIRKHHLHAEVDKRWTRDYPE